jgi:YVTN family beta-propeller protein
MVKLEGVGADWVLTRDRRSLYITVPETGNLLLVDTYSWEITGKLQMPGRPGKLLLQPDEHYLWVAFDQGRSPKSGVVAVDRQKFTPAKEIFTGAGSHDLAMDRDNRSLFASNALDGTVSVIDVAGLNKVEDIAVGPHPVSMDYSKTADLLLVADHEDGKIAVINSGQRNLITQIQAEPGLRQVAFTPEGRLAFAINPETDTLYIIDGATRRIIQSGSVDKRPSSITFSNTLGYIMHQNSDQVLMVPLSQIGTEGKPIPLADFSGGIYPVPALDQPIVNPLVKAPAENAVMLANTADGGINYYSEGMTAPMGHFSNYDHIPKSLMVLDRSLQEDEPGFYQTVTKLTRHGLHDLVLFMESPRVVHCFKVPVLPDLAHNPRGIVRLTYADGPRKIPVNRPFDLRFQLFDGQGAPIDGLTDVVVTAATPDGLWQKRIFAKGEGGGSYLASLTPTRMGSFQIFVRAGSVGLESHNPYSLKMKVTDKPAKVATKTEGAAQ